jgi:hypothetical protein
MYHELQHRESCLLNPSPDEMGFSEYWLSSQKGVLVTKSRLVVERVLARKLRWWGTWQLDPLRDTDQRAD